MQNLFSDIFNSDYPIIGALHFMPLPGYKGFKSLDEVRRAALYDLAAMTEGGVHGIIVENNYDLPHVTSVGPETVAAMTVLTQDIRQRTSLPLGLSVLWNDYAAGFAIAKATGCQFIRISAFVDDVKNQYGTATAVAKEAIAYRRMIAADKVAILADVQVKHAEMIDKNKSLEQSLHEAEQMQADGVILTGSWTGIPPKIEDLKIAQASTRLPVIIGSGATNENITQLKEYSNAAIVGTYFKEGGASKASETNVKTYNQRVVVKKVKSLTNQL